MDLLRAARQVEWLNTPEADRFMLDAQRQFEDLRVEHAGTLDALLALGFEEEAPQDLLERGFRALKDVRALRRRLRERGVSLPAADAYERTIDGIFLLNNELES